jgi:hypothetical protein
VDQNPDRIVTWIDRECISLAVERRVRRDLIPQW